MSSSRPSGSVIAAGVVAICGSCLAILGCGLALIGIALIPATPTASQLPASIKSMAEAMFLFFLAIAVFGVFTGVGVVRLKNWARISALVWAGITTCFSALLILSTLLMPFPNPPGEHAVSLVMLKAFLVLFYSFALGIGIWWLILFNRPNIRAQFSGAVLADQAELPERPRCPLPVAAVAGFLAFSFLCVLVMPLLHVPLPVVLFGYRLHGPLGSGIFLLTAILTLAGAVGLWRLKQWSYPLIVGLQSFWLLSGTITFLSPSYERNMQEVLNEMQMPQANVEFASQIYLHRHSWPFIVGLFPSVLILVILVYYRVPFRNMAQAAARKPD